jgi:4-amino-4-deoxy-L-arabinose transferase-like glycosyltransferase
MPRRGVALLAITSAGLALRLFGAWRAGLSYDEALTWAFASEPGGSGLTLGADRPPLGHLLLAASARLFGASDIGLRVLHVLAAAATIPVVYALGRRLAGPAAGLLAAALLAVDQYHVSWSRLAVEEGLLLLLTALAMLAHWRAQEAEHPDPYALACGLAIGLAFLAKETAALLLPSLALGLAWSRGPREILRDRPSRLTWAAALVLIGAGLAWTLGRPAPGHLERDLAFLSRPLGPSLKGASLYVGELFRLSDPGALDDDYGLVPARAVFWPVGVLHLAAVALAVRSREAKVRQLLALFAVWFAAASLVDARKTFDPYWWGSPSLIAAVLLTARAGAAALERRRALRWALPVLFAGLLARDVSWLRQAGPAWPRLSRADWALRIAADGAARLRARQLDAALDQAVLALILDPTANEARDLIQRVRAARAGGARPTPSP